VPLCIGVVMGPVVGCRPSDTYYRWCLVVTKAVVAGARADGNVGSAVEAAATETLTVEALATEVLALANEGCL
jgi:hypothetical protein